jgi:hypothetical protein
VTYDAAADETPIKPSIGAKIIVSNIRVLKYAHPHPHPHPHPSWPHKIAPTPCKVRSLRRVGGGDTAASKPAMPAHAETNPINAMYEREDGRDMEGLGVVQCFNPPSQTVCKCNAILTGARDGRWICYAAMCC